LHFTTLPAAAVPQLGNTGGAAVHVASMHRPVSALGGSRTNVARNWAYLVAAAYNLFRMVKLMPAPA
jgi:hypothetical protein